MTISAKNTEITHLTAPNGSNVGLSGGGSRLQQGDQAMTMTSTRLFAAMAVRRAIALYLKTGIKVNTAYTPTAMARAASGYTGKVYGRGKNSLAAAHNDLNQWIEAQDGR